MYLLIKPGIACLTLNDVLQIFWNPAHLNAVGGHFRLHGLYIKKNLKTPNSLKSRKLTKSLDLV